MRSSVALLACVIIVGSADARAQMIPFDGCGVLVWGVECLLFEADQGGRYLVGSLDGFNAGDSVRVVGLLDYFCVSFCMEGNGCIWEASVSACSTDICACPCHADPQCDSVTNVFDVVFAVGVAFRNETPVQGALCPYAQSDVDCDDDTDVFDVVHLVAVAFRNANPAGEFCEPCSE